MPSGPAPWSAAGRHAGVMVPLFAIPSRASWGIGEIPDLAHVARWLESAGLDFLQLLPVNEMEEGQSSPYSAMSAMAVDPIFIALRDVSEFADAGGEPALAAEDRAGIDEVRGTAAVDYLAVRAIKARALGLAFAAFVDRHWTAGSERAALLRGFVEREAWWLDDYALFRALHEENGSRYWDEWPADVRACGAGAVAAARDRLSRRILYYQFLQWLADEQWQAARRSRGSVAIFGDFPFMVSGHSADVWARQAEFRVDASVGVPPDAFSATGQDWGLPVYRWDVAARNGYEWLRDRTRRCAEMFDGFRVDHLVGFYRTFVRERDNTTYFVPPGKAAQLEQGERLLGIFASQGSRILAEDLGTVPDFVRASMARLRVPGLKVLRWEREWEQPGQPFRDPARYPTTSVATSGTHDTETMAEWWDHADERERRCVLEIPLMQTLGATTATPLPDATREALIETLFAAASDLVLFPLQDVFGWRDRINRPASTGSQNWTWRLPWPVEDLMTEQEPARRAAVLRRLSKKYRRGGQISIFSP